MPLSRRNFMKSGAMAAVAAGFLLDFPILTPAQDPYPSGPLMGYFTTPPETQRDPLYSYRRSTFEPYVNGIFIGRAANGAPIELKLLRVTGYTPNPRTRVTTGTRHETETFSLTFEASRELPPFTSIHRIEHGALGTFDLFLVPSRVGGRFYYEAVISHI